MVPRGDCIYPNLERSAMFIRRLFRILLLVLPVLLAACAPGSRPPLTQVFPPSSLLPLHVVITRPLVPYSHEAGHVALETWTQSPARRRLLMRCAWQGGLQNLVRTMIPGTEITYLGEGKNPLALVGPGLRAEVDSLGMVHFIQEGQSSLDLARRRGWTHLVIPHEVRYFQDEDGKDFVLTSAAAIIDVLEQRIVWQGIIDSRRISEKELGPDDSTLPALTVFEATSYRFVLDLAQVMGRRLNSRPDSRHQLAQPCQNPPPLLRD